MLTILIAYKDKYKLSGTFTTLLDYYSWLVNLVKVKCVTNNLRLFVKDLSKTFRQYELKAVEETNYCKADIILTDWTSLSAPIKIECSKLLIFDTLEFADYLYNLDTVYKNETNSKILNNFNYEILVTPATYTNNLNCRLYYKRINVDVLSSIQKHKPLKDSFSRVFISKDISVVKPLHLVRSYDIKSSVFNFTTFYYKRRDELGRFENFGRLIFEFLFLNRKVYFMDDMNKNDGLYCYLKLTNSYIDESNVLYCPNINKLDIRNHNINDLIGY